MTRGYALLSVTDKTGLIPFAKGLQKQGYRLLSTAGTLKLLAGEGLEVADVAAVTGFPEILSGRVKTLHPNIHAGILCDRGNPEHMRTLATHGITPIDIVVVNLYDFRSNALSRSLPLAEAIEYIDVGGPTMLRASAKNHQYVLPVCDPNDYDEVLKRLAKGEPELAWRAAMAGKVFRKLAAYDAMISAYLAPRRDANFPDEVVIPLSKVRQLTYGENPHQQAAWYEATDHVPYGWSEGKLLQGEKLSYNNLLDADAAMALVRESALPAVTIIKHNSACGFARGADPVDVLFAKAWEADSTSAFGGIVGTNQTVDEAMARALAPLFVECVIAPAFSPGALSVLSGKKKLRLVEFPLTAPPPALSVEARSLAGAMLLQSRDQLGQESVWRVVTEVFPADEVKEDMQLAWLVAKHLKSNAIVFAKDGATVALSGGQVSRVDAIQNAIAKAQREGKNLTGTVVASDGFFPFRDSIDAIARLGIKAVVQPGGSIRDQEVIAACNEHGIPMVVTGMRHFRH